MDASVLTRGLCKIYRSGVRALAGVSLEVFPGEILGLLGPNGAGKTTTLRVLATLSQPSAGTAIVAGSDVTLQPREARRKLGYVPQTTALDPLATGRENLLFHGHLFRMPSSDLRQRAQRLIEAFGLESVADRQVKTYSGGTKRRLELAAGLLNLPNVLLLDEPTAGLDPSSRHALWEEIRRVADSYRVAVLLTTHYMDEADALATRIAIIDDGRIVLTGRPADLKRTLNGDIVTLELETLHHAERAKAVVNTVAGVVQVFADTTIVCARVPDGSLAVPRIIDALRSAGLALTRASVSRSTLDDVYLEATGKRYAAALAGQATARR